MRNVCYHDKMKYNETDLDENLFAIAFVITSFLVFLFSSVFFDGIIGKQTEVF